MVILTRTNGLNRNVNTIFAKVEGPFPIIPRTESPPPHGFDWPPEVDNRPVLYDIWLLFLKLGLHQIDHGEFVTTS